MRQVFLCEIAADGAGFGDFAAGGGLDRIWGGRGIEVEMVRAAVAGGNPRGPSTTRSALRSG